MLATRRRKTYTRKDAPEIRVGSTIEFINAWGEHIVIHVTRVENKFWYNLGGVVHSYSTLLAYQKFAGFKINY